MKAIEKVTLACFTGLALSCVAATAGAAWTLVPGQSHVVYTSIKVFPDKQASAAENNHFESLSGAVSDDGSAEVRIDLASVATNVAIRDERMRTIVFETENHPEAIISAQVPPSVIGQDGVHQIDLSMVLSLKGVAKPLTVPVIVNTSGTRTTVTALQPVLVAADDFGLDGGLLELTKLAGLMYIPTTVPVYFNLVFQK